MTSYIFFIFQSFQQKFFQSKVSLTSSLTVIHCWFSGLCAPVLKSPFLFIQQEIIAISCSWCKVAYHNKVSCFTMQHIEEPCSLGAHASLIVPPQWIIKMPRKVSFPHPPFQSTPSSPLLSPSPTPLIPCFDPPSIIFRQKTTKNCEIYHFVSCGIAIPLQALALSPGVPSEFELDTSIGG